MKFSEILLKSVVIAVISASFCFSNAVQAAAEQKKEEKKQALMSPLVYKKIEKVNEEIEKKNFQESLSMLDELAEITKDKDNKYEYAVVLQMYGYVYTSMDDYEKAGEYYSQAIKLNALPAEPERAAIYMLAQIYSALDKFQEVIDLMVDWFKTAENPPADAYIIVANAYAAQEQWAKAYPYVIQGVEKAEKDAAQKKEAWYKLKLAVEYELSKYPEAAGTLEILVANWPGKKDYWTQLASIYMELRKDSNALATLASAYEKGVLEQERNLLNLVRLYLLNNVPYTAAKILSDELDKGRIEKTKKNYELLSQAYIHAREYNKGIAALGEAAELADNGEFYLRQARLSMNVADWSGVKKAAQNALRKGGLKDKEKGQAWLLVGTAAAEEDDFDTAIEAFNKARGYTETRALAGSWLEFIKTEMAVSSL